MSVCKKDNGQKRKHKYEDSNKCSVCGHTTTHGANFRKERKKIEEAKPEQIGRIS